MLIFWNNSSSRGDYFQGGTIRYNLIIYDGCNNIEFTVFNHAEKAVKPKLLTLFIAICTFGIIIVGYLFNILVRYLFKRSE